MPKMIRTYYLLTKPGIIIGNLITTSAAFLLGAEGHVDLWLFLMTTLGLGGVIASACVFNNCVDRHADAKMERTKYRGLARGAIPLSRALFFAIFLGICGMLILCVYTNKWAALSAALGFFIYVVLYSFWKYRTMYAMFVGSIAGAMPPVVGYSAAKGHWDLGAWVLFFLLLFWQMPHFFSIVIYRSADYGAANIPVMSSEWGISSVKKHTILYIALFFLSVGMLSFLGYTSLLFAIGGALLGLMWMRIALQGFKADDDTKWAQKMFRTSLMVIMGVSLLLSSDALLCAVLGLSFL